MGAFLFIGLFVAGFVFLVIRAAQVVTAGSSMRAAAHSAPAAFVQTPAQNLAPIRFDGEGEYEFDVVGESYYQEALSRICGGKCEDGHELEVDATLVHEDENPFDDMAIAVMIEGEKVAHLGRDEARTFRRILADKGLTGRAVVVPAMIVGGWLRERRDGRIDEGSFGVKLDLA
jgi:hypothetical protein